MYVRTFVPKSHTDGQEKELQLVVKVCHINCFQHKLFVGLSWNQPGFSTVDLET